MLRKISHTPNIRPLLCSTLTNVKLTWVFFHDGAPGLWIVHCGVSGTVVLKTEGEHQDEDGLECKGHGPELYPKSRHCLTGLYSRLCCFINPEQHDCFVTQIILFIISKMFLLFFTLI